MTDSERLSQHVQQKIDLASAKLGREYYYNSLSLCVIDAVFSISVRYACVEKVIDRYCEYSKTRCERADRCQLPHREDQEAICSFIQRYRTVGCAKMTDYVFKNKQRTSTRSGILKSEAVLQFAECLCSSGVNYFQDIDITETNQRFEPCVLSIPGQGSGLSLKYFLMLAGTEQFIKPDRWIRSFIRDAIGKSVDNSEAHELLTEAAGQLNAVHPKLTPRLLDHEIWKYERAIDGRRSQKRCATDCHS